MAYKQRSFMGPVILVGLALLFYFKGLPWFRENFSKDSSAATSNADVGESCVSNAQRASEAFGSGVGRFVRDPKPDEWASFRSDIDGRIRDALSSCKCAKDSCRKSRDALGILRGILLQLDDASRAGMAPSSDIVSQQERVDQTLDEASSLAKAGN